MVAGRHARREAGLWHIAILWHTAIIVVVWLGQAAHCSGGNLRGNLRGNVYGNVHGNTHGTPAPPAPPQWGQQLKHLNQLKQWNHDKAHEAHEGIRVSLRLSLRASLEPKHSLPVKLRATRCLHSKCRLGVAREGRSACIVRALRGGHANTDDVSVLGKRRGGAGGELVHDSQQHQHQSEHQQQDERETEAIQATSEARDPDTLQPTTEAAKKESKLGILLQRAAAYSAFLRQRLQQSRALLNATSTSSMTGAGNSTLDPRQPKLVSGAVLRGYHR